MFSVAGFSFRTVTARMYRHQGLISSIRIRWAFELIGQAGWHLTRLNATNSMFVLSVRDVGVAESTERVDARFIVYIDIYQSQSRSSVA